MTNKLLDVTVFQVGLHQISHNAMLFAMPKRISCMLLGNMNVETNITTMAQPSLKKKKTLKKCLCTLFKSNTCITVPWQVFGDGHDGHE